MSIDREILRIKLEEVLEELGGIGGFLLVVDDKDTQVGVKSEDPEVSALIIKVTTMAVQHLADQVLLHLQQSKPKDESRLILPTPFGRN